MLLILFNSFLVAASCLTTSEKENGCRFPWVTNKEYCYLRSENEKNYLASTSICRDFNSSIIDDLTTVEIQLIAAEKLNNPRRNFYAFWIRNRLETDNSSEIVDNHSISSNVCSYISFDLSQNGKSYKTGSCYTKRNFICRKSSANDETSFEVNCPDCFRPRKKRSFVLSHYSDDYHDDLYKDPFRGPFNGLSSPQDIFLSKIRPVKPLSGSPSLDYNPWNTHENKLHHILKNLDKFRKIDPFTRMVLQSTTEKSTTLITTMSSTRLPRVIGIRGMGNLTTTTIDSISSTSSDRKFEVKEEHCNEGEFGSQSRCYRIYGVEKTWFEARKICEEKTNGSLLIFDNKKEFPFLGRKFANIQKTDAKYWVQRDIEYFHKDRVGINMHCGTAKYDPLMHAFTLEGYRTCEEKLRFICEYQNPEKELSNSAISKTPLLALSEATCSPDWIWDSEECLKVFHSKTTWREAVSFCQKKQAELLVFDPKKNLQRNYRSLLFTLTFDALETQYFWIGKNNDDGSKTVESNTCDVIMQYPSPTFFSRQKPVEMPCSNFHSFICSRRKDIKGKSISSPKNSSIVVPSTTSISFQGSSKLCSQSFGTGWLRFNNSCFKFFSYAHLKPRSWYEAKDVCIEAGGFLASIHSEEENIWVYSQVTDYQDNFLWIGAKYEGMEGFVWQDGSPFNYANWGGGEPNNLNEEEECVAIYSRYSKGKWNDADCQQKAGHICQITLPSYVKESTSDIPQSSTNKIHTTGVITLLPFVSTSTQAPAYENENTTSTVMPSVERSEPLSVTSSNIILTTSTIPSTMSQNNIKNSNIRENTTSLPISTITSISTRNLSTISTRRVFIFRTPVMVHESTTVKNYASNAYGGCPEDWYKLGDRCVKYIELDYEVNFDDASKHCQKLSKNGTLASIYSREEIDFLRTLVKHFIKVIWVGLKADEKGPLKWQNGDDFRPGRIISLFKIRSFAVFRGPFCLALRSTENYKGFPEKTNCNATTKSLFCQMPSSNMYSTTDALYTSTCGLPSEGFYSFGGSCYKFMEKALNWQEARNACKEIGAELLTIRNAFELTYILRQFSNFLEKHDKDYFWSGLQKSNGETALRWVSGWPLLYTAMKYRNTLKGDRKQRCVSVGKSHFWVTFIGCTTELPFICEKSNKSFFEPPQKAISSQCPQNWIDFGGDFCYNSDPPYQHSWSEANHRCLQLGGYLVSLHSLADVENMKRIMNFLGQSIWIGATRLQNNGGFSWSDLTAVDFEFWENNEPSTNHFEKCVEMTFPEGRWRASGCTKELSYICEVSKSSYISTALKKGSESTNLNQGSRAVVPVIVILLISSIATFTILYYKKRAMKCRSEISTNGFENVVYNSNGNQLDTKTIRAIEENECFLASSDESDKDEGKEAKLAEIAKRIVV